jgi:mono/diheme cytochrome c family protein
MKRFTTAVAAAVLSVALGPSLSGEDKAARGKQLYEEQKCRMCHNLGGAGNLKGATLDEVGSKHAPDVLKMWLTSPKEMAQKASSTRKPPMQSFAKLPAADIEALVAYLSTLKKAGK